MAGRVRREAATSFDAPAPTPGTDIGLAAIVKEDLGRQCGRWSTPGFQALAVHRFGTWAKTRPGLAGKVWRKLHGLLFVLVRNIYGIELPVETQVGRRVLIGHQHGIVIDANAVIGDDCVLRHNVTIGLGTRRDHKDAPRLGNRVTVSPGAVIIGDICIGDDTKIGPNALVTKDVPAGSMVFEKPTRVVQLTKSGVPGDVPGSSPDEART